MYQRICFNLYPMQILRTLSSISTEIPTSQSIMNIQTFVFVDTETTGLPFQEGNKTKITEMCMVAVQAEHICLGVQPRVLSKLSLCFNPLKPITSTCKNLTGLSNDLLQDQPKFQKATVEIIKCFLDMQRKPLCLVAHNGNNFDYPILRAEIYNAGGSLQDDLLCIDSLHAFRQLDSVEEFDVHGLTSSQVPPEFSDGFDELLFEIAEEVEQSHSQLSKAQKANETTPRRQGTSHNINTSNINDCYYMPETKNSKADGKCGQNVKQNLGKSSRVGRQSFKLMDVYARLTKKEPTKAHEAEYDCSMLIECAAKIGERFVDWANVHNRNFSDLPMMQPGRKFGH